MLFRNSMLILGLVLATLVIVTGCGDDDNKVPIFTRTSSSVDCGVVPMDVQFVAITSGGDPMADPTGANSYLDVSWDFGDGTSGNGSVTPHTYTVPGDYDVLVTSPTTTGQVDHVAAIIVRPTPEDHGHLRHHDRRGPRLLRRADSAGEQRRQRELRRPDRRGHPHQRSVGLQRDRPG